MYKRVAELAAKRGLSICKLEQIANVANGTIGKWRNGRGASAETIVKIAKVLGVSTDYLLGVTEELQDGNRKPGQAQGDRR